MGVDYSCVEYMKINDVSFLVNHVFIRTVHGNKKKEKTKRLGRFLDWFVYMNSY